MERVILLIDDSNEQLAVIKSIVSHLKRNEGIIVKYSYINPTDREFWNLNKDPDIHLVLNEIDEKMKTLSPNLVIVDQYYSDTPFNGLDLIASLRAKPKFMKCPFFLISGKRQKIIRDYFVNNKKSVDDKVEFLSSLFDLKISKFLDKHFKSEAIEELKKKSLADIIITKLREFEELNAKLNTFNPRVSSSTYKELADKIASDHHDSYFILDEIIEITLAHYADINGKVS